MDTIKKLNEILVSLFNGVLKMEEHAVKESSKHNLSITEVHTLAAIGIGKAKTMTQVAGILKINVSTLTVAITRLVNKGYVNRFRVSEDRRIVKIELTKGGAEAVAEHEAFHVKMVSDAVFNLNEKERLLLVQSLENINEFFKKQKLKSVRESGSLELKPLKLGELEIPVPIWQGGMGIGVSMAGLASAVSGCGGVGIISCVQPGFAEPDFEDNPHKANLRALQYQVRLALSKVKDVSGRGPVGVNIVCGGRHYGDYIKAAVDAGAEVIVSGTGLSTGLPAACKNSKVKLVPVVSSARAAAVIVKTWAKKYNRTPDAMIFEGPAAGGYLGYKPELLDSAQEDFYQTILEIKAEIQDLQDCPLIAGGGIYTRADVQKALAYGADGVQLGTRFVTTEECDAHENFKKAYFDCTKEDITVIKSPAGMPWRAIRNAFVKRLDVEPISQEKCISCTTACKTPDAPYCVMKALLRAARGDTENGLVFCGSNAYRADKSEKVTDIFRELCASQ